MDIYSIILIAIGLAMDCLSVSLAKGIASGKKGLRMIGWPVLMAFLFGAFQGGMPLISFYAGSLFAETISAIDHWIALVLLSVIGGKMVWDSLHGEEEAHQAGFRIGELLLLAIATSIDALATGIIFVPVPEVIWVGVAIIGGVSFMFSIAGFYLGAFLGKHIRLNMELIGGVILIGIGVKIFLEHMLG